MFNEANAVENLVRDLLTGAPSPGTTVQSPPAAYAGAPVVKATAGLGWQNIAGKDLPRTQADVLIIPWLQDALVKLNPCIALNTAFADEVLYKLRAILLSVGTDGLEKANEEFTAWLRGERTMPFGPNNEHVPVHLIDFDDWRSNHRVVSTQVTYKSGVERRFDLVLWINGIPLVIGEAKTPTRSAVSWVDGAAQVHDNYEINVPAFFVPNVFSFATEGKTPLGTPGSVRDLSGTLPESGEDALSVDGGRVACQLPMDLESGSRARGGTGFLPVPCAGKRGVAGRFRSPFGTTLGFHPGSEVESDFAAAISLCTAGGSLKPLSGCASRLPLTLLRFTPACAGNRSASKSSASRSAVHPRLRGE